MALAAPLSAEDMLVQSMADASPTKWHLAHTTWFFEEFVLARFDPAHRWGDERWRILFNSYYESAGPRHPRMARGLLSRPSLHEVRAWRSRVDEQMLALLAVVDADALAVTLLGTHHEEQHQELLLTDAKHALSSNPLRPAYEPASASARSAGSARSAAHDGALRWCAHEEGIALVGCEGDRFAFDNESPRHRVFVDSFLLASRLVTNREYAAFIADGGYERPELWLSDGWATARSEGWGAPLYWERHEGSFRHFTLHGLRPLDDDAPVSHASFYEADAYARWAGGRLPTEDEWEVVAAGCAVEGNFLESGRLAPVPPASLEGPDRPAQLFGDVWEWTASAYLPYPKFRPLEGTLGEYNGKFMSGQMVLRGGSCFSPQGHLRPSYRNFFPPHTRWQMAGIRLARDA